MIIDVSAIVAVALGESSADAVLDAMVAADRCAISAPTLVEACIVIDARRNPTASRRLDEFLADADIEVIPFTAEQARIARQAYRDYGRGSGHPANLNFGDCFSYALAAERREPLLYVGDDFGQTDLHSALST
jgi:ribonuclease VapC